LFDQQSASRQGTGEDEFDAGTHATDQLLSDQRGLLLCRFARLWLCARAERGEARMGADDREIPCHAAKSCAIYSYHRLAARAFQARPVDERVVERKG